VPVLALDTCTDFCSVALLAEGRPLAEMSLKARTGHAGMLLKLIDYLLEVCLCPKETIDLIAVGRGPGSFTGIRIGIATAKGLATALNCRLAGVCSLDAMAMAALPSAIPLLPILDARKGEVFCARYSSEGQRLSEYMHIPPGQIRELINEPTLFLGNGLDLYAEELAEELGPNFQPAPRVLWHPRAAVVGAMAIEQREGLAATVNPLYVRASDAVLTLRKD
jgi:tRNA threonylcarbamoyladenosine biosynthesis protein TsaB